MNNIEKSKILTFYVDKDKFAEYAEKNISIKKLNNWSAVELYLDGNLIKTPIRKISLDIELEKPTSVKIEFLDYPSPDKSLDIKEGK
ncbi:MAG: hypothetical protein ACW991_00680 [Candidatus Hodarchaeales archaeon]|jgi:hypothetical protein